MPSLLTLENCLILACARTDPDVDYIQELVERGLDWQAIARRAEYWGIAPLVYASVRPLASFDQVPSPVAEQLRYLYRRDTIHSVAQRDLLRVILLRFWEEGVSVIVLQGAALATLVYPSPTLRPIGDIDLLIHAHDREKAEKILRDIEAGHPNIPYLGLRGFDQLKIHEHIPTARGSAGRRAAAARLPAQDVWKRAQPAQIESVTTLVLSHEDLLLQLALQLSASNRVDGHVRSLCDIGETWRRYGNEIDWGRLVMHAERYQVAKQLSYALHLARDLVGADVPTPALAALRASFGQLPFEDRFIAAVAREVILSDKEADSSFSTLYTLSLQLLATSRAADGFRIASGYLAGSGQTGLRRHRSATLKVSHDAGLTSCLSVRLHEVSRYRADHGRYPDEVDSGSQFQQYADNEGQNVAAMLLAPARFMEDGPYIHFHYGQQFAWYRHLDLQGLQRLARNYCWPSKWVVHEAHGLMRSMQGRTAILYRGNDKIQEIPRTPYEKMFEMAERSGSHQFWVQTDEADFFDAFKTCFPDTRRIEELPMIRRDDSASVLLQTGRAEFAVTFLAALYAIAHAPQIICTTGNTAVWPMIFRGHIRGVWQYSDAYPTYVHGEQSVWIMRNEIGATLRDWNGEGWAADEVPDPGQH